MKTKSKINQNENGFDFKVLNVKKTILVVDTVWKIVIKN